MEANVDKIPASHGGCPLMDESEWQSERGCNRSQTGRRENFGRLVLTDGWIQLQSLSLATIYTDNTLTWIAESLSRDRLKS